MTALPLPDIHDPLMAPYWAEAANHRLAMQRCPACAYVRWPAARICPQCLADGGDWTNLSGKGRIWSYAVYDRPLHPAFEGKTPYAVALVTLDEGPMIYGRMADMHDRLACDLAVRAVFAELAPGVWVHRFALESCA